MLKQILRPYDRPFKEPMRDHLSAVFLNKAQSEPDRADKDYTLTEAAIYWSMDTSDGSGGLAARAMDIIDRLENQVEPYSGREEQELAIAHEVMFYLAGEIAIMHIPPSFGVGGSDGGDDRGGGDDDPSREPLPSGGDSLRVFEPGF